MSANKIIIFILSLVFLPLLYMAITLKLGESAGWETVNQLNYGLIIGFLLLIVINKRKKNWY